MQTTPASDQLLSCKSSGLFVLELGEGVISDKSSAAAVIVLENEVTLVKGSYNHYECKIMFYHEKDEFHCSSAIYDVVFDIVWHSCGDSIPCVKSSSITKSDTSDLSVDLVLDVGLCDKKAAIFIRPVSLDIIMNTWIVVIGGLLYTIALLGFIYYYMTKQRHLYFVLASDQVIEGDQNVDLKWEWKPEPPTKAGERSKYYDITTNSVIIPHDGVWNVDFAILVKGSESLRNFDVFINNKHFGYYQQVPSGNWASLTPSFSAQLKKGDRIRISATSPNGKFEMSAYGSYLTLSE